MISIAGGAAGGPVGLAVAGLASLFSKLMFGGGMSYNNPADRVRMQLGLGVLPDEYREWLADLEAPEGTPTELLQLEDSGLLRGVPKWVGQRLQEFGFTQSGTGIGSKDPWWTSFINNPLSILTATGLGQMGRPWGQPLGQQGTGETPTEGGNLPGGTQQGPDTGTGEGPADFTIDVNERIRQISESNQLSWSEKATLLAGLGVSAAVIPFLIGAEPIASTTVTAPMDIEPQPSDTSGQPTAYPVTPVNYPPFSGYPTSYDPYTGHPVFSTTVTAPILAEPPMPGSDWPGIVPTPVASVIDFSTPQAGMWLYPWMQTTPPPPLELPYDPSPIEGSPTPSPVPGVDIPPTSGGTTSNKGSTPDLSGLTAAFNSSNGGGGGIPGAPAPVVGGGHLVQSLFQLPGITQPPPTLADFMKALQLGAWRGR